MCVWLCSFPKPTFETGLGTSGLSYCRQAIKDRGPIPPVPDPGRISRAIGRQTPTLFGTGASAGSNYPPRSYLWTVHSFPLQAVPITRADVQCTRSSEHDESAEREECPAHERWRLFVATNFLGRNALLGNQPWSSLFEKPTSKDFLLGLIKTQIGLIEFPS